MVRPAVHRERRLGKSQPAALFFLDRNGGSISLAISNAKPIRAYGLRQEEDRSRAVTSDACGFSGSGIEKTFVVAIG
jgi:hypothetical protein